MTRLARVIAVDVPHHVTQRGNARRFILDCDADRMAYLNLLRRNIELHGLGLIGYCLMSNHVHLVVTPHNTDGLGLPLKAYPWALCDLLECGSSVERPCQAGSLLLMPIGSGASVGSVALYGVEPGARRLGQGGGKRGRGPARQRTAERKNCGNEALDLELWRKSWLASAWRQYLAAGEMESKLTEIRRCTHTGRPLGSAEFVQALEGTMKRRLAPQKGGRPSKAGLDARQSELAFESR